MEISFASDSEYSGHGREFAQEGGLELVSRTDLRWYYFLGRLSISKSGIDVGPPWGWVPLFDAMYSVQQTMLFLQGKGAFGDIDFTENDELIKFEVTQGILHVVPTYSELEIRCSVDEFLEAGTGFIKEQLRRVATEFPTLAHNKHALALGQDFGLDNLRR